MNSIFVKVYVFANSKKEKTRKIKKDVFEVFVREPAKQNMANKRVMEIISDKYGVGKGQIKLITGHRSPNKRFEIMI